MRCRFIDRCVMSRRCDDTRFWLLVMSIFMRLVVVVFQFFHVYRRRIVCSIHAMNIEAFASLQSFVSSRGLCWSGVLNRLVFNIVHDGNIDCWLWNGLLLVIQLSRQCLRVAIIFIRFIKSSWWKSILLMRRSSTGCQPVCAFAETSQCVNVGTKNEQY